MLIRTSTPLDTQIVRLAITQRRLLFVNTVEMLQAKRIEGENNVAASCGIHSENTKSEVARCESRRPRCVAGRSKLTNGSWQQTLVRRDSVIQQGTTQASVGIENIDRARGGAYPRRRFRSRWIRPNRRFPKQCSTSVPPRTPPPARG